ncbi:MAG: hypothetical protein ACLGH6_02405 [Gammaproteobacteria bacterium]
MKRGLIVMLTSGLLALAGGAVAAGQAEVAATVLLWQEQDAGGPPYASRMLVTRDYLRSDEGRDDSDYLLFDRRTRQIFSVSHAQRSVLVIAADPVPAQAGPRPDIDVQVAAQADAPRIAGHVASHVRLSSGGTECLHATVVPGLLPDVAAALRELRGVLAGRQYRDLDKTPEELRTPCFLANYVYAGDRHLQLGLPIQEAVSGGVRRQLEDYRSDQAVPAALFALPSGYERLEMP